MNLPRTVKRPARRQKPRLRTIVVPGTRKRVPLWKTKRLWLSLSAGVLLLLLVTGGLAAMAVSKLDVTKAGYPLPDPTNVYDRNGKAVAQFSSSKVEPVALDRIPLDLRNAVIATEDRRFYEHSGVDVQSLMRALWRDVRSQSFAEGGSTITQQLAKNLFLQSDKTLSRKFKEAGYALKIDLTYDKDEILELYLNSIYFGEGTWGVQGAAKVYFNKKVEDLTLEECAMLAALPKAPSRYSPYRDRAAALERRNVVLSLMKDQNFITGEAYAKAQAMPIAVRKPSEEETKDKYPSFVDYVLREAESVYGFSEDQIRNGGLEIYTTLDPVVQEAAEEVYRTDSFFPASKPDQLIQSGAAIVDHHDGSIRGLVGHRGEGVVRGFNYATQLVRQPGSAFKPLAVYGPALEKGYTPQSILFDGPLDIGGYQPRDWDNQTRGYVTLDEAVTKSWNIPAVWLLNEIGIDEGLAFAKRAGIPLTKEDRQLATALGGLSRGVSPLQMAQAFSAFPNLGEMHPAHAIAKITTRDGSVLVEAKEPPVKVTTPRVAYTITGLLGNVVRVGTGTEAGLDRPTAGKTGTTQLPNTPEFAGISGAVSKDAWFVGYTPELTAAIWMGYENTDKNHYLTTSGSAYPAQVFKEIMTRALKNTPVQAFPEPPGGAIQAPPSEPPAGPYVPVSPRPETAVPADNGNGEVRGNGPPPEDRGSGKEAKDDKPDKKDNGKDKEKGKGKKDD